MRKKFIALLALTTILFGGMSFVHASATGWKTAPTNLAGYIAKSGTYSLTSSHNNILGTDFNLYSQGINQLPSNFVGDSLRKGFVIIYEKDTFSSTPIQHYTMSFNGRVFMGMDCDSIIETGIIESDGTAEIYIESLIQRNSGDANVNTGAVYRYNISLNA